MFLGVKSLVAGSLFLLIYAADPSGRSPWLVTLHRAPWLAIELYLLVYVGIAALVRFWSHLSSWSDAHRLALASGTLLAPAWHSFSWEPFVPSLCVIPLLDLISKIPLAMALLEMVALQPRKEERTTGQDDEVRAVPV